MISKFISEQGSRIACLGLIDKLAPLLTESDRLNLLAVTPTEAEEYDKQIQEQLELFTAVEAAREDVETYMNSRFDDAASVGTYRSMSIRSQAAPIPGNEETQKTSFADQ